MNSKEAAEILGLTTDTIRYYERVGVVPPNYCGGLSNFNIGLYPFISNWVFFA